jgi:hypothetical protein
MPETGLSGLEGGARFKPSFLPLSLKQGCGYGLPRAGCPFRARAGAAPLKPGLQVESQT